MNSLRELAEWLKNMLTWWVTVAPWEQAIRVRLGKHVRLLGPGVHLRIPVFDRIYRQSVRMRTSSLAAQTLATRDGKALTVSLVVGYRIADLLRLYETLHHAEGTILGVVMSAVGAFVVSRTSAECSPEALAAQVAPLCRLERYGLADISVTVVSFAYVRTYRMITGEGHAWSSGEPLDTSRADGPNPGGMIY